MAAADAYAPLGVLPIQNLPAWLARMDGCSLCAKRIARPGTINFYQEQLEMKWSLIALATLSLTSGLASAQSSVTLSGRVDAGIRRVGSADGGSDWQMGGSGSSFNRLVFSGREDLRGGMFAIFSLQHRFNIQNGTAAGTTFNQPANANVFWRESWVGLGGGFGDVRLGRMIMPLQDMNGGFDPWDVSTVASVHTGGINATIRGNNVVYYRSPNLAGLSMHAAVAAGEGQLSAENGGGIAGSITPAGLVNSERPIGFNVRYAAGPINVGVAYDRNGADMKTTGVYGSFNFGAFRVMGQFEKGDNFTSAAGTVAEDIKNLSISLAAPLGPVELRAGYVRVNSDLAGRDGSKVGLGAFYNLSKRTGIYTDVAKATGDRFTSAQKKAAFDIGARHSF
jgi:predicted porin